LDLPVQGLLATSDAVAIVLGLALQSTLSDVFSGIVLDVAPIDQVIWISIESGIDGRVIEMNWRATHVLTAKAGLGERAEQHHRQGEDHQRELAVGYPRCDRNDSSRKRHAAIVR
jgi:hypothetical protein